MSERKSPTQSATLYKVGTKKKGNDNNTWIITENKNGVKKWILYKKVSSIKESTNKKKIMTNPDDYYKQFPNYKEPIQDISFFISKIKSIQDDLKKIGVLFFFLKWGKDSLYVGHHDYIHELIDKKINKYPNGYIYTSDALLYSYSLEKDSIIYLHHGVQEHIINDVNKILISNLPNRTLGIQNRKDAIVVNIKEKKKIIKTKEHIKWMVAFMFKDKKLMQTTEEMNKVIKFILDNISKKIINRVDDAFHSKGDTTLFINIYTDKIDEFVEKIKNLKIKSLPELRKLIIKEGDEAILKKSWVFEY
jgi:hypothetical protein